MERMGTVEAYVEENVETAMFRYDAYIPNPVTVTVIFRGNSVLGSGHQRGYPRLGSARVRSRA